jgi:hypothetical protein
MLAMTKRQEHDDPQGYDRKVTKALIYQPAGHQEHLDNS